MTKFEPLSLNSHKAIIKENKPSWFSAPILLDWVLVFGLQGFCHWLDRQQPFKNDAKLWLDDPSVQYPHVEVERVPSVQRHAERMESLILQVVHSGLLLYALTWWLPVGLIIIIGAARYSAHEIHHGLLSFLAGWNMTWFLTTFIKLQVGRLRPDFFARCQWDKIQQACTGAEDIVREGRKSFPSGHSSAAIYSGIFIMLFLASKNRAFIFSTFESSPRSMLLSIFQARLFRLYLVGLPILQSIWIVISRWEDHWHHPTDIIAGSLLGTLVALLSYHMFWLSPFLEQNVHTMSRPRPTTVDLLAPADGQEADDLERQTLLGEAGHSAAR